MQGWREGWPLASSLLDQREHEAARLEEMVGLGMRALGEIGTSALLAWAPSTGPPAIEHDQSVRSRWMARVAVSS